MRDAFVATFSAVLWTAMGVGSAAWGDTLTVGSLQRKDLEVTGIRNGIVQVSIGGRAVEGVPAAKVGTITLGNDAVFSAAERAYSAGDWAKAAEGYLAAMANTQRPWLADWAMPRLLVSANRAGKAELAAQAFVAVLGKDPAAAMREWPVVKMGDVAELGRMAKLLEGKRAAVANTAVMNAAMAGLLLDVRLAQGDLASAEKLWEELGAMKQSFGRDPAGLRIVARAALGGARLALLQGKFDEALRRIEAAKAEIVEPADQAAALAVMAQAMDQRAGEGASAEAREDVALAYLRAAGVYRQIGDRAEVAGALLRVAEIEQQLGDTAGARALYAEVAREYKDMPFAGQAAAALGHLKD